MSEQSRPCPICAAAAPAWERYPRMVCRACVDAAVDGHGSPVVLHNTGLLGTGLELIAGGVRLTDDDAAAFPIFIKGIACRAQEHRFGGVVVQVVAAGETSD